MDCATPRSPRPATDKFDSDQGEQVQASESEELTAYFNCAHHEYAKDCDEQAARDACDELNPTD